MNFNPTSLKIIGPGLALAAGLGAAQIAAAAERVDIFAAETIVTGTGEAERARGLAHALKEVLIRASGVADLEANPGLAAILERADGLVLDFSYEDRKKGRKISDEQGTRDRSQIFRVRFDEDGIRRSLASLGLGLWPAERKRLMIWLAVEDGRGRYVLGHDGDRGYYQRESLRAIAKRRGVPIVLPFLDDWDGPFGFADVAAGEGGKREAAEVRYGTDGALVGILTILPDGYWRVAWTLKTSGIVESRSAVGITFDSAIRLGIESAAEALSRAEK